MLVLENGPGDELPPTLWHALELARAETKHCLVVDDGHAARRISWAEIARRARSAGAALLALGLRPGARVGVVTADPEEFAVAFLGAIACGALPVAIAPTSPVAGTNGERIAQLLACCGAQHVVAGMLAFAPGETRHVAGVRVISFGELDAQEPLEELPAAPEPSAICFLQLTSGSTRLPRAIAVTHDNVIQNIRATHALLGSKGQLEVGVTWLPLWHDMGLIASLLTPMVGRNTHVIIPAQRFAGSPRSWLEAVHAHRATITATTNFGLHLALKRMPRDPNLDLSSLRVVLIGAEPINPQVLRAFEERFTPFGLSPAALCPAYGMAEATLAISLSRPDQPASTLRVERAALEREGRVEPSVAEGLELISCGTVVPGHTVKVLDAAGRELPDDSVGELAFAGPSLTAGEFASDRVAAHGLTTGLLRTGDLGFVHGGELYICGRAKDLIIVAGRNLSPQVIEWQLGHLGARENGAVAFSVPGQGTERLVIVAEYDDPREADAFAVRVRVAIPRELGVSVDDVVVVRPWTLPKTTSGKVQRSKVRDMYLRGQLPRTAVPATQTRGEP